VYPTRYAPSADNDGVGRSAGGGVGDNSAVVPAEQIRTVLRTTWQRTATECTPLQGGMNSAAWLVTLATGRYVAKLVCAARRAQFEAGLLAAAYLEARGVTAGAPVRTVDGALTVPVGTGVMALLRYVPGRPLVRDDPLDQQWWGDVLGSAHRALDGFTDPGLVRWHWVRPEAAHLGVEAWVRPAVADAVAALNKLCVTDVLAYGVLHGDPAPEACRIDVATGRTGLLDWGSVATGPLVYDVASAVMYAGGPDRAADLLDGYVAAGPVLRDEVEAALPTMLRFRWAVQADYFAQRLAADDRTGIAGPEENLAGLHDARDALAALAGG
jgi:homoserine kinase type II